MKHLKILLNPVRNKYRSVLLRLRKSPKKIALLCEEAARKQNVIPDIHSCDFIFEFIMQHPSFKDPQNAVNYYFEDGAKSAEKLIKIIQQDMGLKDKFHLLEFASGYGCVTRHFKNYLPEASYTSCDIHVDAVNFIKNKIKTPAILSNSIPEKLILPDKYDVIFALSFFSHMPKITWGRWLKALADKLKNDGYLIFTTHGMKSLQLFEKPELDSEGFYFIPLSEQKDLSESEYGSTIVHPRFVHKVCGEAGIDNIIFHEAYWWGHQDLYIVTKSKSGLKSIIP